jgi:hypothetical protein
MGKYFGTGHLSTVSNRPLRANLRHRDNFLPMARMRTIPVSPLLRMGQSCRPGLVSECPWRYCPSFAWSALRPNGHGPRQGQKREGPKRDSGSVAERDESPAAPQRGALLFCQDEHALCLRRRNAERTIVAATARHPTTPPPAFSRAHNEWAGDGRPGWDAQDEPRRTAVG